MLHVICTYLTSIVVCWFIYEHPTNTLHPVYRSTVLKRKLTFKGEVRLISFYSFEYTRILLVTRTVHLHKSRNRGAVPVCLRGDLIWPFTIILNILGCICLNPGHQNWKSSKEKTKNLLSGKKTLPLISIHFLWNVHSHLNMGEPLDTHTQKQQIFFSCHIEGTCCELLRFGRSFSVSSNTYSYVFHF